MTLIEVLIALGLLAMIVPVALDCFGTVFTAGLRLNETAEKASLAEWWFNRLEHPLSLSALDAAPRTDRRGRMRFSWETKPDSHGALRVTLSVTNGSGSDVPFTASRVY